MSLREASATQQTSCRFFFFPPQKPFKKKRSLNGRTSTSLCVPRDLRSAAPHCSRCILAVFFLSLSFCFPALLVSISLMPLFILPFLPCRSALMALLWRRISHANSRQFVRESSRTFFQDVFLGAVGSCFSICLDTRRCSTGRGLDGDRPELNFCSVFFFPAAFALSIFFPSLGQKQRDPRCVDKSFCSC